ncbi:MAG: 30S ribosomal protein S1 [Clostridia bacterium]|nr:30S ribosomal protein S1 [Clostridia bacterium]
MSEEGVKHPEGEAEEANAPPVAENDGAEGEPDLGLPDLRPGALVQGTVVQVNEDNVLVDVGYKSDGVIPYGELNLAPEQKPSDLFRVGARIPVVVLQVEGQEGGLVLSYRRAVERAAWDRLERAYRDKEVVTAPVVEAVKGGLVVDVGLRGFMPASHVELGYVNDLSVYVGQPIRARVIEIDRHKNRVILSQKVVLEEERERLRQKTWSELKEGQIRRGVVKGLTDFGAFVDLGGVDGLLHVSEMAWGRVNQPSDVVNVGDEIDVMILRLDPERGRISLGLKQVLPDPWTTVEERYQVGSVVEGKVMRLAPFGAFVQLEPGVEGLVHISQMADWHVNDPGEVVQPGQEVRVKILRISPEERRISLSIKEAERPEIYRQRSFVPPPPRRDRDRDRERDNPTLGDMFGSFFEETRERLEDGERDTR